MNWRKEILYSGTTPGDRRRARTDRLRPSAAIVASTVLFAAALSAEQPPQEQPPPPPSDFPIRIQVSPPPQPPILGDPDVVYQPREEELSAEDPYWRETVERAIAEYASENPDARRSAVMLLGKYPVEPARRIVTEALEDPVPAVRQAALVSVLEEQGQGYPNFGPKLIRMLADPDVSIRRIASDSLRLAFHGFPLLTQGGTLQMQRQLPEESNRILRKAFQDEDVSVRRNMVNNYPFLRIDLPEETIVSLLHDEDDEVAIHTLRWGLSALSPPALAREVKALAQHDNHLFRLELARSLQTRPSSAMLDALEILKKDEHPAVAIEAMLASFNHRQFVGLYREMVELYRKSGGRGDAGQRIIFAAQMLGDDGEPFLREWMEDSNPAHRQQATQVYLGRFGQRVEVDFLLSLLDDTAQGVRQQAMRALMQSADRLTAEHVRQTAASRHVDVRRSASSLAALLPANQAEDILLDLLLDDARDVRLSALQQIGLHRIDGWEEIMNISLRVDDPVTQRSALDWLMRHTTQETLEMLRAYRDENPRSPLRAQIEAHLRRYQPSDAL